jgi:ATP-binding cassette subfamily B multidrug efflux pump
MKMKHNENLRSVLRRTASASRATCALTALVILLAVVSALFPPLMLERAVNDLTQGRAVPLSLALVYFGFIALSGLLESGQNVMITVFGQKVTHGLRSALCRKLRRLPAGYFTAHEAGKITSVFVNDVDTVDSLFTEGIVSMFADGCKIVSILIVIFTKSLGLGLLMLLVTPLLFWMTRQFQKRMLQAQYENRVAVGKVNNHVPETIRSIRMIHVLLREK